MSLMSKATVYLPDDLMRELRKRARESAVSLSLIVADAVRQRLSEDAIDIAAYESRNSEVSLTVAEARKHLKDSGRL